MRPKKTPPQKPAVSGMEKYMACLKGSCVRKECDYCARDVILYNMYTLMVTEAFKMFSNMVRMGLRERALKCLNDEVANSLRRIQLLKRKETLLKEVQKLMRRGFKVGKIVDGELCSVEKELASIPVLTMGKKLECEAHLRASETIVHALFPEMCVFDNIKHCWYLLTYLYYTLVTLKPRGQESSVFFEQYHLGKKVCQDLFGCTYSLTAHQFLSHISLFSMNALEISDPKSKRFNFWMLNTLVSKCFGDGISDAKISTLAAIDDLLMRRARTFETIVVWNLKDCRRITPANQQPAIERLFMFEYDTSRNEAFFAGVRSLGSYARRAFSGLVGLRNSDDFSYDSKLCLLFNMTRRSLFSGTLRF